MSKEIEVDIEAKLAEIKALTRLNSRQQARIRYLLQTPSGQEFEFFKRLIGLTPAQARLLMAEEFFRRFKPENSSPKFTWEMLLKSLPLCRTWLKLDDSIKAFIKKREMCFSLIGMGPKYEVIFGELSRELARRFDQELCFWDNMRYLVESLPKPQEFKDKYADKTDQRFPKRGWDFETCDLCWRTMPVNSYLRKKTGRLCFEHDLPATDPVYRRHKRLRVRVYSEYYMPIVKRIRQKYPPGMPDIDFIARLKIELTGQKSVLPNLVKHLKEVGHDGRRESLLRAFHGPFPKNLSPTYREAMETFFRDVLQYPSFLTMNELILAEAWLKAIQADRRRKNNKPLKTPS